MRMLITTTVRPAARRVVISAIDEQIESSCTRDRNQFR